MKATLSDSNWLQMVEGDLPDRDLQGRPQTGADITGRWFRSRGDALNFAKRRGIAIVESEEAA